MRGGRVPNVHHQRRRAPGGAGPRPRRGDEGGRGARGRGGRGLGEDAVLLHGGRAHSGKVHAGKAGGQEAGEGERGVEGGGVQGVQASVLVVPPEEAMALLGDGALLLPPAVWLLCPPF